MTAEDERLEHLLRLARLELAPGEAAGVAADLELLLGYLDRLQEADVEGGPEWTPPIPGGAALRADDLAPSLDRATALSLAPNAQDGFFRVPRVLEGD